MKLIKTLRPRKKRFRFSSQMRRISAKVEEGSPSMTVPFLKWRFAVVEDTLEIGALQRQAQAKPTNFLSSTGLSETELMVAVKEDEKALISEKVILLSQRKSFEEYLIRPISTYFFWVPDSTIPRSRSGRYPIDHNDRSIY